MVPTQPTYRFDPTALTGPVDAQAKQAFAERMKALRQSEASAGSGGTMSRVLGGVIFTIMGSIFAIVGITMIGVGMASGGLFPSMTIAFIPILFAFVGIVFASVGILILVRGESTTGYRLDAFARANGMHYHPGRRAPNLPGMIFHIGSSRASRHLVYGDQPRFVEFGNYQYTTGSGKNRTTHTWGYIAVKLDTPLPHIVLDAESNNGLFRSSLPIGFRKDQRLDLEGDFNTHFSLYCPGGYETDALYLFTPDVMQRFLDSAAQLDVEIVDDWLFFYSRRNLVTLDADQWAWTFSVVGAMLDKLAQWGRWRDERLRAAGVPAGAGGPTPVSPDHVEHSAIQSPEALRPPHGVAHEGRRLQRTRFSWSIGIGIAAIIVYQVIRNIL
ncbi:hypothetical protein [Microbacterium amylolyticum]|uniref:DUF3137 domain-containing protein n=1 Tax=Microbacterium amylolyticum TaxID=936337 RepID=A0ABS4ZI58_9MICO|nr:hypothetical protein [Microbacterium amylolyticum]MBP2436957.1 hypothetical protein [Microbacterium amylolyticum]